MGRAYLHPGGDTDATSKQFCKEVVIWNSLPHPNILKLVSVLKDVSEHPFATVSEWMANGNIMEYIGRNATNRLRLVCVSHLQFSDFFSYALNVSYMTRRKD